MIQIQIDKKLEGDRRLDFTVGSSSPTPIIAIIQPDPQDNVDKTPNPPVQPVEPNFVEPIPQNQDENPVKIDDQEPNDDKTPELTEEQKIQQEIQKRIAELEFQSFQRQQEEKYLDKPPKTPTIHEEPPKNPLTTVNYRNLQQNHSENERGDIEFHRFQELTNFTSMYISLFNISQISETIIKRNLAFLNYSSIVQPPRPTASELEYHRKITKLYELETSRWNDVRSSFRLELPSSLTEEINKIKKAEDEEDKDRSEEERADEDPITKRSIIYQSCSGIVDKITKEDINDFNVLILGSSVGELTNKLSINFPKSSILAVEKNTTYQKLHYQKMKENQIENQILATRAINSEFIDELSNEKGLFFRFTMLLDLFELMHELLPHEFELYLGKLILKSQTTFIFIPDDQQDGISEFINYFQYWKSFTQLLMNACAKVNAPNAIINSFAYHRVFRVDLPVLPSFQVNFLPFNDFPVCFYRNSSECFIKSNFQTNFNISNILNYKKIKDSSNKVNLIKESAPLTFISSKNNPFSIFNDEKSSENETKSFFESFMNEKLKSVPQEYSGGEKKQNKFANYCSAIPFSFIKKFSIYPEQKMDLLMKLSYSNLFPVDLMEFEEFNFFNFISQEAFVDFLQFKGQNFQFNQFLFDYFQLIQWDSSNLKYFNLSTALPPVTPPDLFENQPREQKPASNFDEKLPFPSQKPQNPSEVLKISVELDENEKNEEEKQKELIQWIRNLPDDDEKIEFLRALLNITDFNVPLPLNKENKTEPVDEDAAERERLLKEEKEEEQRKQAAIGRNLLWNSWDYLGNNPVARPVATTFSTGPPQAPNSMNLNKISSVNSFLSSNSPPLSVSYSMMDQLAELNMLYTKDQVKELNIREKEEGEEEGGLWLVVNNYLLSTKLAKLKENAQIVHLESNPQQTELQNQLKHYQNVNKNLIIGTRDFYVMEFIDNLRNTPTIMINQFLDGNELFSAIFNSFRLEKNQKNLEKIQFYEFKKNICKVLSLSKTTYIFLIPFTEFKFYSSLFFGNEFEYADYSQFFNDCCDRSNEYLEENEFIHKLDVATIPLSRSEQSKLSPEEEEQLKRLMASLSAQDRAKVNTQKKNFELIEVKYSGQRKVKGIKNEYFVEYSFLEPPRQWKVKNERNFVQSKNSNNILGSFVDLATLISFNISVTMKQLLFNNYLKLALEEDMNPKNLFYFPNFLKDDQNLLSLQYFTGTTGYVRKETHKINRNQLSQLILNEVENKSEFSFLHFNSGEGDFSTKIASEYSNSTVVSFEFNDQNFEKHETKVLQNESFNNLVCKNQFSKEVVDLIKQSPEFFQYQLVSNSTSILSAIPGGIGNEPMNYLNKLYSRLATIAIQTFIEFPSSTLLSLATCTIFPELFMPLSSLSVPASQFWQIISHPIPLFQHSSMKLLNSLIEGEGVEKIKLSELTSIDDSFDLIKIHSLNITRNIRHHFLLPEHEIKEKHTRTYTLHHEYGNTYLIRNDDNSTIIYDKFGISLIAALRLHPSDKLVTRLYSQFLQLPIYEDMAPWNIQFKAGQLYYVDKDSSESSFDWLLPHASQFFLALINYRETIKAFNMCGSAAIVKGNPPEVGQCVRSFNDGPCTDPSFPVPCANEKCYSTFVDCLRALAESESDFRFKLERGVFIPEHGIPPPPEVRQTTIINLL